MTMNTSQLRAAYDEVVRQRSPGSRADCPAPERIAAVVERTGNEADRLETLDHVLACAACRREFDMLRTASQASQGTLTTTPVRTARFRVASFVALAATLLLAVGILSTRLRGPVNGGSTVRGGGAAIELVAPRRLPSREVLLTWRSVTGVATYRVEVLDQDGRRLVDTSLVDTTLVLSDSLVRVARAQVWSVGARLRGGSSVDPRAGTIR